MSILCFCLLGWTANYVFWNIMSDYLDFPEYRARFFFLSVIPFAFIFTVVSIMIWELIRAFYGFAKTKWYQRGGRNDIL